ncbi:hypothetical protein, partial [Benzoatithermus flavus]
MPFPTPRQRLVAARQLALGDDLESAAAEAGIELEALERLLEDVGFARLRVAQARLLHLSEEAWNERLQGMLRFGIESALADGKVSTVNLLLRERAALRAGGPPASPRARAAMAETVAALDDEKEPEEDEEEDAAEDAAAADAAVLPPVEADPAREAARLAILASL